MAIKADTLQSYKDKVKILQTRDDDYYTVSFTYNGVSREGTPEDFLGDDDALIAVVWQVSPEEGYRRFYVSQMTNVQHTNI